MRQLTCLGSAIRRHAPILHHSKARPHAMALPDPGRLLHEVREIAELARAGAYIGGDRLVSPKERSRWRLTFRRLAADADAALRAPDSASAEEALTLIVDLACEMKDSGYFRSEDPVEAARFVVSEAVALRGYGDPVSRTSPASPPRSAPGDIPAGAMR